MIYRGETLITPRWNIGRGALAYPLARRSPIWRRTDGNSPRTIVIALTCYEIDNANGLSRSLSRDHEAFSRQRKWTRPSPSPATIIFPLGATLAVRTSESATNVATISPVSRSQTITVQSAPADTACLP